MLLNVIEIVGQEEDIDRSTIIIIIPISFGMLLFSLHKSLLDPWKPII